MALTGKTVASVKQLQRRGLARLRTLKREVDPGNLFRDNGWVMAGV